MPTLRDAKLSPSLPDLPEVLTLSEAAELLRVSVRSLQRLVKAEAVPYAMLGRAIRFRRAKLLTWLDRGGERRRHEAVAPRGWGRAQAAARGVAGDVLVALEEPAAEATLDMRGARA